MLENVQLPDILPSSLIVGTIAYHESKLLFYFSVLLLSIFLYCNAVLFLSPDLWLGFACSLIITLMNEAGRGTTLHWKKTALYLLLTFFMLWFL